MVLRFVQLSDIHFGQERDGSVVTHDDVRDHLIKDAAVMAADRGPATRVLIVGDTAYSGKKKEYDTAGAFLDRLTRAAKCPETHVRVVPGNHDCDLEHVGYVCRMMHKQLRQESVGASYGLLEALAKEPEDAHPLLPKLGAYRTFAAGYDSKFESIGKPIWTEDFDFPNGVTLRLVGLNSVQVCEGSDKIGTMLLGNEQYTLRATDEHVVYAVMVHHPLEWFRDSVDAKRFLHSRARMLMFGHEHVPEINKTTNLQTERLDIFSGATNPPEREAPYRHAYNWIEVESRVEDTSVKLHVTVFPRAWIPDRTRFDADLARLSGDRSRRFDIACAGVVPRTTPALPERGVGIAGASGVATSLAATSSSADNPNPKGASMNPTEDDAGLAKLKLFFWRDLDWRQRLTVLVQADILPPTADKPVPQTLEDLAIERAREDGKLAALWDATMPFLPEEKQSSNPFREAGR